MPDPLAALLASLAQHYTIEREAGVGGMATVYVARDLKHDRHVALKVLKPELAALLGIQRFLTEIRVTAHLQHPHILPLLASGQAPGLIYSLASVLYEMLGGEPPHTGPTVQSVIAKVVTDRPRPLRALRDAVPPPLEAAVQKALAKVPADRYGSAAQFAEALTHAPATPTLKVPAAGEHPPRARALALAPRALALPPAGTPPWGGVRPPPKPLAAPTLRFSLT